MVLFKTENLTFDYPNAQGSALKNVNIQINYGDFVLLMGKTGSGKSTLLKLLVAPIAPSGNKTGEIFSNTSSIGYVPQNTDASFVSDTVRGELAFALENQGLDNNTISLKIGEISSFFNLTDLLDRQISTLSGGEKASVAVASAMVKRVDALILDEPVSQLDSKASYELINLLKRVNDELGVTVIMSSHISDGIIDKCTRLAVLDEGEVIFNDSASNVNDDVLPFYPLSARLFEDRPLTVRQALSCTKSLKEKPVQSKSFSREILSLKNVTFAYQKNSNNVLDALNFKAYDGAIHCIIGANGSGKTTLLKIIAGIKKPYAGRVKVKGRVAYLPQNPKYLFTKDTVGEEISTEAAEKFGFSDLLDRHPYDLSGGQQQRLALALLSQQSYDILLLDEPSKSLDTFYKTELVSYLKSLGKTIIIVSHDLDFVGDIADYVSFLSDGIITLNGERRQVLSSLDYYTTQIRRITRGTLESACSAEDLL